MPNIAYQKAKYQGNPEVQVVYEKYRYMEIQKIDKIIKQQRRSWKTNTVSIERGIQKILHYNYYITKEVSRKS